MVCLSNRVSKWIFFARRCVSSALTIWAAGPAKFWDWDARVWLLSEWIGRHNVVILCRSEYHSEVANIATSQGGWDVTCMGFEFIFELV